FAAVAASCPVAAIEVAGYGPRLANCSAYGVIRTIVTTATAATAPPHAKPEPTDSAWRLKKRAILASAGCGRRSTRAITALENPASDGSAAIDLRSRPSVE